MEETMIFIKLTVPCLFFSAKVSDFLVSKNCFSNKNDFFSYQNQLKAIYF